MSRIILTGTQNIYNGAVVFTSGAFLKYDINPIGLKAHGPLVFSKSTCEYFGIFLYLHIELLKRYKFFRLFSQLRSIS